jgi:hypothetical protein
LTPAWSAHIEVANYSFTATLRASAGPVSKQLGILYDAQLLVRTREGNFIRYAIGDDTTIQLCNLVCRKIENDALARVAAFKGVSSTSSKRNSQRGWAATQSHALYPDPRNREQAHDEPIELSTISRHR